ncbi:MAG: molybdate ABC transporter permease subunit [Gammaproteobacteria bacterium]|jgi:molybdate transport system permease protein|nr:molybdate ABC transporter permease subunit [Chromatiales bacterium]MCP4926404.1 molybdate ABC transporter permease subunit [Gammaproteobacteria bacterium]MDP7154664.1 molybdate ABC transporter permease subunit [Gammaproteobacteria bacterium]MDP7297625.1 molybdate ABC transporter permease subunit [Gammaproteobacteria bacterium]MDP7418493.1 molybdate ABC transporter permease subunit [Gammaproteobacteria bacterium]
MSIFSFPGSGPIGLSAQLAAVTTLVLILIGTPLAWWLSGTSSRAKSIIEATVALPIVLPPTVMGFYLLILLGPYGAIGHWWVELTGETLTFSFSGLVIASCFYSLPFAVQPLQNAFEALDRRNLEAAWTLGASRLDAFFTVAVPQSARGFLNAIVLAFAHTLGEFGVVLMVGGNIPGETRVISIAIYDQVESLNYTNAHQLSAILLTFAFSALLLMYVINRRWQRR